MKNFSSSTYLILLFFLFCVPSQQESPDYYWREFHGIVPEDAVPGGLDEDGNPTFIGQGFLVNEGVFPGTIYPGRNSIFVPMASRRNEIPTYLYVTILCSPDPSAFKWIRTNQAGFYVDSIGKYVVHVGQQSVHPLPLGRIAYQGEVTIGKIWTANPASAPMYFYLRGAEKATDSYEFLVYDP